MTPHEARKTNEQINTNITEMRRSLKGKTVRKYSQSKTLKLRERRQKVSEGKK
jgi:hypothetical protein